MVVVGAAVLVAVGVLVVVGVAVDVGVAELSVDDSAALPAEMLTPVPVGGLVTGSVFVGAFVVGLGVAFPCAAVFVLVVGFAFAADFALAAAVAAVRRVTFDFRLPDRWCAVVARVR